jgi:hypothetical protein
MQQPFLWLTLLALVAVHAWINIRKASLPKEGGYHQDDPAQRPD